MFAKELQHAGHVRRFSIREHAVGWEIREEEDNEVLKQVYHSDWHRVERALNVFRMQIGLLEQSGWRS
jgi:hypothetical protein